MDFTPRVALVTHFVVRMLVLVLPVDNHKTFIISMRKFIKKTYFQQQVIILKIIQISCRLTHPVFPIILQRITRSHIMMFDSMLFVDKTYWYSISVNNSDLLFPDILWVFTSVLNPYYDI